MKTFAVAMALVAAMAGCTANERAKAWGGTMTVRLPCQQRLVLATWKELSLWYMTAPMPDDHTPVTSTFHEDSTWGVMQGTVKFVECR